MQTYRRSTLATLAAGAWIILLLAACTGAASLPEPGATSAPAGGVPTTGGDNGNGNGDPSEFAPGDSAYIVRTGSLTMEVTDLDTALPQAQALIIGMGGYISGSEENRDRDSAYAVITYRIPVARWYDALNGLRAMGKVLGENSEAADVTAAVVDLDARLANLRVAETQYQGILARAVTIDEVLKVQRVLDDTRGEIERLQAQRDNLANQAALATLAVSWLVPTAATAAASEGWDFGREVDRAFAALVTMGQGLATLGIWLGIAVLPIVVPVTVIGLVGYRVLRPRPKRVTMDPSAPAGG